MTLVSDWNDYQSELEDAIRQVLAKQQKPPADVVLLLKTKDLKEALELADKAKKNDDVDLAREAQAASQKFFFKYANQFKAAKVAAKAANLDELSDALNMYLVYMTRTQVAVADNAKNLIQAAKDSATTDAEKLELSIKSALSPLKFKADWKAAKKDFETATGKKKPSDKVLKGYRKSAGMEDSLSDMDKACEDADPAAYRKAFYKFQAAAADYASILEKALASDKDADDIYHTKCGGLKEMLNSLETRANEKMKMLDDLGV